MLDSGVAITSSGSNGIDCGDDLLRKHYYSFKVPYNNTHEKYTVEFHEYKYSMFVGKYYPTKYRHDKDKYALVFDDHRGIRFVSQVLRTVQDIFLKIYTKYPQASFGFIGEPKKVKIKPKKGKGYTITREEKLERTKRFELYRKICLRDIGIESFTLYENTQKSAIILINNDISNTKNYKDKIITMMKNNYSILDL